MESRQVKENGVTTNGKIRTTEFTDGSKLIEQLFDATLVSGKPKAKVTDSSPAKNVSLGFDVKIEDVEKPFSALMYETYYNKVRETNEEAFDEGTEVVLAISVAKDRNGEWKKYGRIALPKVVTADHAIPDNLIDDEVLAEMRKAEATADAEAQKTDG